MLGKYIKINGQQMPNPISFEDGINPNENEYYSESGKRMTNVIRLDRTSWTATFQCTSRMKAILDGFCKTGSVTSQIDGGTVITGTLRRASGGVLLPNSELCSDTQGLWTISVVFEGD